jgi:hypothetical protein
MRAELAHEPVCTLEEKTGTVRGTFSFAMIEAAGQLVELSWEDSRAQENRKLHGERSDASLNLRRRPSPSRFGCLWVSSWRPVGSISSCAP